MTNSVLKLKVLDKKVLWEMFGPKGEEGTGGF
jgi:hypothetical protein